MKYQLTLGSGVLERLQQMNLGRSLQTTVFPVGFLRLPERAEWLLGNHERDTWNVTQPGLSQLTVVSGEHSEFLEAEFERRRTQLGSPGATNVLLAMGTGRSAGRIGAACHLNQTVTVDEVKFVMPGLPCTTTLETDGSPKIPTDDADVGEIWSRTIGALGATVFHRLRKLHVAVVGCGRSGSQIASSLARTGISQISLIDPDVLDFHNLGEMAGVTTEDVGRPKTEAVAGHLNRFGPVATGSSIGSVVHSIPTSILSLPGLIAAKRADVLFCCVDDAAARVATAFIATLYLRPLIDIGTSVLRSSPPANNGLPTGQTTSRSMGADVRLIVPGERCLMCLGGVADFAGARTSLLSKRGVIDKPDWRKQRAGSLFSLNGVASRLAIRLLEDFFAARVEQSTWLRIGLREQGETAVRRRVLASNSECTLCLLNGRGDAGVGRFSQFITSC